MKKDQPVLSAFLKDWRTQLSAHISDPAAFNTNGYPYPSDKMRLPATVIHPENDRSGGLYVEYVGDTFCESKVHFTVVYYQANKGSHEHLQANFDAFAERAFDVIAECVFTPEPVEVEVYGMSGPRLAGPSQELFAGEIGLTLHYSEPHP